MTRSPILVLLLLAAFLTHCHQEILKPPQAGFSVQGGNCNAPCELTFTSSTTQTGQSYTWDFGDGKTGTGLTVKHIYSSPKTYAVKLIVNGEGGSSGSTQSLTINNPAYLPLPFATMVLVKGGTFTMGDTRNEGGSNEKPVRQVTVSDFYMAQYEVTQRQWQAIMGSNPSASTPCNDCPVNDISWDNAQAFLVRLNQQRPTGTPAFRLPTEAEWEYAAGGGASTNRTRFGNGKDIANPAEMNYDGSDYFGIPVYSVLGVNRSRLITVGSFLPNGLGLYDLGGNAWEWCNDWYAAYTSISSTNPTGPTTGTNRVIRGGSYFFGSDRCRIAYRFSYFPSHRHSSNGFRVVSSLQ